jgi:hypothetical protein
MTSETLRAVSGIATRFDEHSKLLTSASDILGAAQTNLATTLGDRQNALEDLAVGLVRKSEEIERLMRSFEGILEGSLERAELRARESSDTIRSSMVDIVEAATQRFADATVEIRRTAEQIRGELDETRSALKKGVIDMPAEAKEIYNGHPPRGRRADKRAEGALRHSSEVWPWRRPQGDIGRSACCNARRQPAPHQSAQSH